MAVRISVTATSNICLDELCEYVYYKNSLSAPPSTQYQQELLNRFYSDSHTLDFHTHLELHRTEKQQYHMKAPLKNSI